MYLYTVTKFVISIWYYYFR